jgi:hypothetical protein
MEANSCGDRRQQKRARQELNLGAVIAHEEEQEELLRQGQ